MEPDADTYSITIKIIILLILIMLSAFFSSAETSFVTLGKLRVKEMVRSGKKNAKRVEKILDNKDKMISAILIGNNCVNMFASSITTIIAYELYGDAFISIATGIITIIILIFGEIVPKTLATKKADKIALIYSIPISFLMMILSPVIFFVNQFSGFIMLIFGIKKDSSDDEITEEALKTMVDVSQEEGVLEKEEHEMIHNIFEFNDRCAKDIMIPRASIVGISRNSTYEEIMETFKIEKYTRLVIYEDDMLNVAGIINIRDMIHVDKETFNIDKILRNPCITFEYKKISELLKEMKKTSNNMSIIIDEYGDIVGLLTLEDILEELVGEIRDEYDEDELLQIQMISENTYEVDGVLKIDDVNRSLNLEIESEDYDSIGGYIIEQLDRLPVVGDIVNKELFDLEVVEIENNRIRKIQIKIKAESN